MPTVIILKQYRGERAGFDGALLLIGFIVGLVVSVVQPIVHQRGCPVNTTAELRTAPSRECFKGRRLLYDHKHCTVTDNGAPYGFATTATIA